MKYVLPALCLLLASCSTNYPPERAPIVPQAPPPIVITVRGGDFSQRTEHPLEQYMQRRREPEFEETLYQRKPIYEPEQYTNPTPYTRPDPVPQTPLEYTPRYPYYDK